MWLAFALLAVVMATGCRSGGPIIDTGPRPEGIHGTISGTVRGPQGSAAIDGRVVEVVNLETGDRQQVTTNAAGGFTFKVRPGKYRVELTLRPGETIVKGPGVMQVGESDIDAHADFVISTSGGGGVSERSTRPRLPATRLDPDLGSPMA